MNTKEKIEEYQRRIKVMEAYENGERLVELKVLKTKDRWSLLVTSPPAWDWANNDYRIKPKPREFWLNVYKNRGFNTSSTSKEEADQLAIIGRIECIKVREII